eukprot:1577309-Alexandrium_andersonii.AAC.1
MCLCPSWNTSPGTPDAQFVHCMRSATVRPLQWPLVVAGNRGMDGALPGHDNDEDSNGGDGIAMVVAATGAVATMRTRALQADIFNHREPHVSA